MNIKSKIKEYMDVLEVDSYEALALKLGTSKANIDKWIQRKSIPSKWILIMEKLAKNTGNYIKTIQTNNGHIVQGKSIIHDQPTQDPREKTLLDKFRTLSEIGKIEVENCINNTYLKELRENTDK